MNFQCDYFYKFSYSLLFCSSHQSSFAISFEETRESTWKKKTDFLYRLPVSDRFKAKRYILHLEYAPAHNIMWIRMKNTQKNLQENVTKRKTKEWPNEYKNEMKTKRWHEKSFTKWEKKEVMVWLSVQYGMYNEITMAMKIVK